MYSDRSPHFLYIFSTPQHPLANMSHTAFGSVSRDTDEGGSRTSAPSSQGHPRYIKGEFVFYEVPGKAIMEPRHAAQIPSDSAAPPSGSPEQMDKIDHLQTLSVSHEWEE